MKYYAFIFFFCFAFLTGRAQNPYAIHLDKSTGLPSNSVYNIFQDSKGFIWFATNAGLTRYDGFEHKTFQAETQTSTPGSGIKEDKHGRIWYENFDGYIYYIEHDSLKALHQNKPITFTPIGITDKYLFAFQTAGIDVYDINTLRLIKTIKLSVYKTEHSVSNEHNFYCVIGNILYRINDKLEIQSTDYFKNKSETTKQIYCSEKEIFVMSKFNEDKSIYVFNENLQYSLTIHAETPEFIQGACFTDSLIWILTPKGAWGYSEKSNNIYSTYITKNISSILKDRQNNYWFATTNEGVYLVPDLNTMVYSLDGFIPGKIVETKAEYIIATKKGELLSYDKQFYSSKILNKNTDKSEIYYLYYDSLRNDLFYSSTGFSYLPQLNYNKKITYAPALKQMIKIDQSYYAFASSGFCGLLKTAGTKTASPWDNVYQKNIKAKVPGASVLIEGVRGKSVSYNKENNTLYFSTNIGLFKADQTKTEEIRFDTVSFYAISLVSFKQDLYALSTRGKLYRITNDKEFSLLNSELNGSPATIKLIKQFNDTLVFVSNRHAYVLDMNTRKHLQIDLNIDPYEINDLLLKKNTLLLVTNSGVISLSVDNNNKKNEGAILQLNDLIVKGKILNPDLENLLSYYQNSISLHYSILDFGNSGSNQLFYRINEEEWKLVSGETRVIEFAELSPGSYQVELRLNTSGLIKKTSFIISSPFWKKNWFILICFVILLITGFTYYRWQLGKLRNKNKLLEDKNVLLQEKIVLENSLNKSVLTSIKSQMNPHFFYNALNTIQAYIFTNDKTKANSYLAKFSKLTRLILEQSELELISLGDEIESLTLYLELEKMRFQEGFEYTIEAKNETHKDSIAFPPMILQPYVENAVKHGLLHKERERRLHVLFEEHRQQLIVTIDDNGIGRKRSGELNTIKNVKYQSFSSQANEKRLEILNRGKTNKVAVEYIDKKDANGNASGTTVIITIPTL